MTTIDKSNIFFISNIYPIDGGYIAYDKNYLQKIISPKKIRGLEQKYPLSNLKQHLKQEQRIINDHDKKLPTRTLYLKEIRYEANNNEFIPTLDYMSFDPIEYDYLYSIRNYLLYDIYIPPSIIDDYFIQSKKPSNNTILHQPIELPNESNVKDENNKPPKESIVNLLSEIQIIETKIVSEGDADNDTQDDDEDIPALDPLDVYKNTKSIFSNFQKTEQKDIIEADSDNVIFVDAGPGTGKTYTLIQRIQYLVEKCNIPADEIQVLCFTNSAVNEIKERVNNFIKNDGDRSLANVDVRTFHSFSWWLIGEVNNQKWDNITMHNLDYDQSIRIVSRIMANPDYYPQIVGNWKHFIVDEIQDLTNHLAWFVLNIVNACLGNKTGVTVLGDSCQAIYDYTLKYENDQRLGSYAFYKKLAKAIEETGIYCMMEENHRQKEKLLTFTIDYRDSILSQIITDIQHEVVKISNKIEKVNGVYLSIDYEKEIKRIRNGNQKSKICFACRNNGQTLRLSSVFRKKGIDHTLNVETAEKNYAVWISDMFYNYNMPNMNRDIFVDRYNSLVRQKSFKTPEDIWQKILYLTKTENVISVSDLLRKIGSSKIDDDCFRYTSESNILISTIHKTKGREYEHIVVDGNFIADLIQKEKPIGEYKTLYVALTRAKETIHSATLSESSILRKTKKINRWGRMNKGRVISFELKNNIDINIESFLNDDIQDYMSNICIGDPITLSKKREDKKVRYSIIHNFEDIPRVIGKINDVYTDDLRKQMDLPESNYIDLPDTITDLYVSGKYTYIATEDYLKAHPEIAKLSPNGVWQWVEFVGIGHASYDTY